MQEIESVPRKIIDANKIIYKILLASIFLPTLVSYLMGWGEPLTSESFEYAPEWFKYAKTIWLFVITFFLIYPIRYKFVKNIFFKLMLTTAALILLLETTPYHSAENILVYSLFINCILFLALLFLKVDTRCLYGNMNFILYLFFMGFIIQIAAYIFLGILPSHSSSDADFIRFNGITNDSLSTAVLLPALIPVAVNHPYSIFMVSILIICSALTGSYFAIVFMVVALMGYFLIYRNYKALGIFTAIGLVAIFIRWESINQTFEHKYLSILTHIRFYLNSVNLDFGQPAKDCSVEFCESLIESGIYLNQYMICLYYVGLIFLIIKTKNKVKENDCIINQSIFMLGLSLFFASLVHPVPLIPFACTFFIILSSASIERR